MSSDEKDEQTRQSIRARIQATSRDEVIRQEMLRLGFWKPEDGDAKMTDEWLERRAELAKEVRELSAKQRKFDNRQAMLAEMRKRRMKEARERREETKQRREQQRQDKAAAWKAQQTRDIIYLGENVSAGLNKTSTTEENQAPLPKFDLPKIDSIEALAKYFDTTVGELRFLAFNREVSKTTHYRRFYLTKKSGGQRLISAPMPRLKEIQYQILNRLLYRVDVHDAVHGFAPGRSILTNAQPHVGQDVVINMDMKDFFPTVTYPRVKGLFRTLGYPEKVATVLALISTEPDAEEVELDGERYFVHTSERHLPQGAPTSPAITNVMCYRLDKRLAGMADKLGYKYTRYADDVTFSASGEPAGQVKKLLWRAHSIIENEGFKVHPEKTRIMRKGSRQEVTGLIVNDGVTVPRRELRNFRALLHQIEKDGSSKGKSWHGSEKYLLPAIRGYSYFIKMVDPEKGQAYVDRTSAILRKEKWSHEIRHPRKALEKKSSTKRGSSAVGKKQTGESWSQGKFKGFINRLKEFWKKN